MSSPLISCNECKSRSRSFFSDAAPEMLEFVDEMKTCQHFRKGQIIFNEGSRPNGVYCINSGKVKMFKNGIDGKEQIISFAKEGDMIGYRAIVADEQLSTSAETLTEATICFIPRSVFEKALINNPDIAKKMLKHLCHELGLAGDRLTAMAQKSVRERVAETLVMLNEIFDHNQGDEGVIPVTLPREDLANLAGTATETLIRILADFKEEGLIELMGKKIKILNSNKLKRLAQLI